MSSCGTTLIDCEYTDVPAGAVVARVYDRMPVIVESNQEDLC